ncbi:MAG: stage II sporulation protein M [Armatimonadota bacterium]|nr:stage II sporulation protein M [bacterium]
MTSRDTDNFKRLDDLLKSLESGGARKMSSEDVLAFGSLYRRAVSALSTARSQGVDDAKIEYLNNLVSRAYGHIYVAQSKGWPSIATFFKSGFPQTFRQNLHFILLAFAISIVAGLFAFGVVNRDQGLAEVVLGPQAPDMIDSVASRHEGHKNWMPAEQRPMMSSLIITNNIKVAMLAFALGITAGVGTFAILFQNGLMLGVIAAAVKARGAHVAWGFWSFVAPHGIIELTAIFIAGGAGLMIGWALLSPGRYTRSTALKLAGREAAKLLLGVAAMLLVAGIVEGFLSPSMLPNEVKLTSSTMLGIVLFSYLFGAGRGTQASR